MSRGKTRKDLALSVGSQLGFKLLGLLVLTLLARGLGVEEFGFLMFALATSELLVLATEFGSSNHLVREVAVDPDRALGRFADVLGLRLLCQALFMVAMAAIAVVVASGTFATFLACAAYAALKDLHRTFAALFNGVRRVTLSIAAFGSHLVVLAAGVALATLLGAGVSGVAVAYLVAGLWLVTTGVVLVRRRLGPFAPRLTAAPWRNIIAPSLPLFGLGLLTMIQLRIDVALLGVLRPLHDVAIYEASARLFEASQAIVRPLTLVLLPICAAHAAARRFRDLERSMVGLAAAALAAGAVLALGAFVLADWVILIVYGAPFAAAAAVLPINFAATPFVFLGAVAAFHATALRRERAALACAAAGLALNVTLDLILIPRLGAPGAAWATLVAEGVTALGMAALVGSTLRGKRHASGPADTLALGEA